MNNTYGYGFIKEQRSTFPYWFAHWCAYNLIAICLHQWKFKYLFHDWYKPWMKLFCSYERVQMFHNKHSSHHLLHWFLYDKADWEAMVIDWECSRLTKQASPRNARDEAKRIFDTFKEFDSSSNKTVRQLKILNMVPEIGSAEEHIYFYKIQKAEEEINKVLDKFML